MGGDIVCLASLVTTLLVEDRNRVIVETAQKSAKKLKEERRAQAAARSQAN